MLEREPGEGDHLATLSLLIYAALTHPPNHPATRPAETLYLAWEHTATALTWAGVPMGYAWWGSVQYCLSEVME